MFRAAKASHGGDPVAAWAEITGNPELAARYKSARGTGGFVRASWDEAVELAAAAYVHTIRAWGPDRIAAFSPIPAMSMVSHAAGARFHTLIGAPLLSFRVLAAGLTVILAGAAIQAFTPSLVPLGTIAYLAMAAALGAGAGAVFALVAMLAPAHAVGSVTGVVGAADGLGGFIPPLVMGFVYGQFHTYAAGLAALAVVAAAALALAATAVRAALAIRAAGAAALTGK